MVQPNEDPNITAIRKYYYDLVGKTPTIYQANPANFPFIHFAAHALPNRKSPLDSSIVLSQGRLYAREIEKTPLSDTLVTISACQSAGRGGCWREFP